jgi:hypothetical protein
MDIHIHFKKKSQSHEQGREEWITDDENEFLEEVNIGFTK